MPNRSLLMIRLSQFGLTWIATFMLVLLAVLAARFGLNQNLITTADVLLRLALIGLGVALAAALVGTVLARESLVTKVAGIALVLVLALPLLWSPVLAVVFAAQVAHVPIEYSTVYAGFRITVGKLLYPIVQSVVSGQAIDAVWSAFETVATIVGFIASSLEILRLFRRRSV